MAKNLQNMRIIYKSTDPKTESIPNNKENLSKAKKVIKIHSLKQVEKCTLLYIQRSKNEWQQTTCQKLYKEKHKVMTLIYWKHACVEFYTKQKYNSNKMIKLNLKAFAQQKKP